MDKLVEAYKTMHGYSWIDAQEQKRLEIVAQMVCDYLSSVYGKNIDFESHPEHKFLALNGMLYALNNAFDDFKMNYEHDLISLSMEGMVSNAKIEGSIK